MLRFCKYILSAFAIIAVSSCTMVNRESKVEEVYQNTKTGDVLRIQQASKAMRSKEGNESRVALLLPLTGENALLGRHMLDATQLAMFDLKADNIHLVPIDTAAGTEYIKEKLDTEQPDLILGPLYAADAKAIHAYASSNNICMISFSNDKDLAGKDCLFLLGVMPDESVKRIAKYAMNKHLPDINGVLPKNKYGQTIEAGLASLNKSSEQSVKIIGRYNPATIKEDLKQVNANIAHYAKADTTLLVPEGGNNLREFVTDLRGTKGGKKVKYLGSGLWEDEKLHDIPELNGAWFASAPRNDRQSFEKRFEENFNYKPSKLSSLAYDGIALIAALSQKGIDRSSFNKASITNSAGFKGITGIFRFKSNGTNQRAMAVYEIRNDGFLEIDPAPQSFASVDYD
jgi:branched-chain amino acid transport system substrate-binding protein